MSKKLIIKPGSDPLGIYFQKVWNFRSLIFTFAKRDLKVKYAQTFLGIGWTLIQPAAFTFLFSFFFGYILQWKSGDIPFPLYVCSGLLGWNFFSYIVFQGTGSIGESSQIIKKIYFPKLLLPLSKVVVALVELSISAVLLIGLMIFYGQFPSWKIVFLPFVMCLNLIAAFSLVTWIGSFSYKRRDLIHLVPFIIYCGIWITPIFFTTSILPESWGFIWKLNPMTGITELWRWCLFPAWDFNIEYLYSTFVLIPLLLVGTWLYIKNESAFSDFS